MTEEQKNDTARLMELLRRQYEKLDDCGEISVSPALLSSKVMDEIDPEQAAPVMVRIAATLELRQLARSICRKHVEEGEDQASQSTLFEDQLQPRYPAHRGGEEMYVLREHLTLREREDNISRLRKEAASKARHADALQFETNNLITLGKLAA